MKVAFLSQSDLNLYLFRLSWMKALIREGLQVYAICPKGDYTNRLKKEGVGVIHYNIKKNSFNPLNEVKTIYELYKIFKKENFDILQSFILKPNIYGAIAGRLADIPIIINTVTGLGYVYTVNSSKARLLKLLSKVLYKLSFKIARKVIFQNSDDFNDLNGLLDKNKALIMKGTGVDITYFSHKNVDLGRIKAIKDELKIENDKLVITMIARLYWSKGIKEFVEAANMLHKKHRNLVFLIIGWIDKGNPDAITEGFIKKATNEFVKFIGKREDIREILYVTDIYVLPSYREGMPRTVLEAMAMEKPIVTTDAPGCREAVENGVNGFLIPIKNSKALAEAIEKLILNKDLRKKMGRASREKVVKEFSDEVIVHKVLQLYEDILRDCKMLK
ncbi:MAG TPA: glycosyltransferase family 1 protein [Candidatus Atribacteria bacterium]|nr:glycosyltransferase family 1 protein [Candidatus Atribacteria bacterium]